jgi:3-methyladenine DNA glycosylase AlkD
VENKFEEIQIITILLNRLKKQFRAGTFAEIEFWFENGIHNWAHTDLICSRIITPLLTQQKIPLEYFSCWRESLNKFQKRAVPVSFLAYLKQDDIDLDRILSFLEPMMTEMDKPVQQGLGWFLRDAWVKFPEEIEPFLHKWKNKSGRILMQYALEKMPKEDKAAFRLPRQV